MIFYPSILALLAGSFLTVFILFYACWYGIQILRRWDISSGSELQLALERRTYLISTIMSYALGFQLLSLFLFIYTADHLSALFSGAMCAAGTLNVNSLGYPALLLKIVNALAAGIWLVVNATDNRAFDYPLIRIKYGLLLPITVLLCTEAVLQTSYFLMLKPDIITSCCGTLFSSASNDSASIATLSWKAAAIAFYSLSVLGFASGLRVYLAGKGIWLFSLSSAALFVASSLALIVYISPYIYELPTHHCPFCILHPEYYFVGYPLYLAYLVGGIAGVGAGTVSFFSKIPSIRATLPMIVKELTLVSLISWFVSICVSTGWILTSNLRMS